MSKFNSVKVSGPHEVNFMGETAYKMSEKEELVNLVLTTFLSDSYYMSENDVCSQIIKLADEVGYEFVAKLALYARNECNMRSSSHLLAALACKGSPSIEGLKDFYDKIVVRPDDMAEILCCYAKLNGIDMSKTFKKIPNSMKRGFKKALERLSPYQIDKYKMASKSISLVDLVNLLHPKANEKNSEAYRRLMKGESLAGTYDGKILEQEMSGCCQKEGMTGAEKRQAKHDAIVSVLESGMPVMNLLRNLRNIILYAPDKIDLAIIQLTNEKKILNSRLLPFRFASAYAEVEKMTLCDAEDNGSAIKFEDEISDGLTEEKLSEIKAKVLTTLEAAIEISCQNIPELDGNCAILIDHSGSVRGDAGGSSKVSAFSKVSTAMIGNLFGSMMAFRQNNVYIGMFGDRLIPVKVDRSEGLLKMNAESFKQGAKCGGSTENGLYEFLRNAIAEKKRIDNLIVFSDMEIGNGGEGGWDSTSRSGVPFKKLFAEFKKLNPSCLTACCNIFGRSGTNVFNPALGVLNISGWSSNVFDIIALRQAGKAKTLVSEIEKISFTSSQNFV